MDISKLTPEQKAALLQELENEQQAILKRTENERKQYKQIAEDTVEAVFPKLETISAYMADAKKEVIDTFATVIDLKKELYNVKSEQKSHTFMNASGNKRITVGFRTLDRYDSTAEVGIEKVKQYLESLISGADNKLITIVDRLLKRDNEGNLKASRVLELQKIAKEINDPLFLDGVEIIADSFRPERSADFITAEYKNELSQWKTVPLSVSSVD